MLKNYSSKSFQEQVIVRACVLFSEKGQKRPKKGKIFKNLGKYVLNLKII